MLEKQIKIKGCQVSIIKPNTCAYCDKGIDPIIINKFAYKYYDQNNIVVTYQCPCCEQIFFAMYPITLGNNLALLYYYEIIGGHKTEEKFDECLKDVSQNFLDNYNDAYFAEQAGCTHILGIAYRRAFEFLIKDYAIKYNPEQVAEIKKKSLSKCIEDYFPDNESKELLIRTNWIGNDFAHYQSKHEDIDINDLKQLIMLSVQIIVADVKKKDYISKIK